MPKGLGRPSGKAGEMAQGLRKLAVIKKKNQNPNISHGSFLQPVHILYLTHTSDMVGVMSLFQQLLTPFIKKSKLYQTILVSTDTSSITVNSCSLHSDDFWQMDLTHIYSLDCFTSVPVLCLFRLHLFYSSDTHVCLSCLQILLSL